VKPNAVQLTSFVDQWAMAFVGQFATCKDNYYSSTPVHFNTAQKWSSEVPTVVRWQLSRTCDAEYNQEWNENGAPWCCQELTVDNSNTFPPYSDEAFAKLGGHGGCPEGQCNAFASGRDCRTCRSPAFTHNLPADRARQCPANKQSRVPVGFCTKCVGDRVYGRHTVSPNPYYKSDTVWPANSGGGGGCQACITENYMQSGILKYLDPGLAQYKSSVCNYGTGELQQAGKCMGEPFTYSRYDSTRPLAGQPVVNVLAGEKTLLCDASKSDIQTQLQLGLCQCEPEFTGPTCAMPSKLSTCNGHGTRTKLDDSPYALPGQQYYWCDCDAGYFGMYCQNQDGPEQGEMECGVFEIVNGQAVYVECNGEATCTASGCGPACANINLDPYAMCREYKAVGEYGIVALHQNTLLQNSEGCTDSVRERIKNQTVLAWINPKACDIKDLVEVRLGGCPTLPPTPVPPTPGPPPPPSPLPVAPATAAPTPGGPYQCSLAATTPENCPLSSCNSTFDPSSGMWTGNNVTWGASDMAFFGADGNGYRVSPIPLPAGICMRWDATTGKHNAFVPSASAIAGAFIKMKGSTCVPSVTTYTYWQTITKVRKYESQSDVMKALKSSCTTDCGDGCSLLNHWPGQDDVLQQTWKTMTGVHQDEQENGLDTDKLNHLTKAGAPGYPTPPLWYPTADCVWKAMSSSLCPADSRCTAPTQWRWSVDVMEPSGNNLLQPWNSMCPAGKYYSQIEPCFCSKCPAGRSVAASKPTNTPVNLNTPCFLCPAGHYAESGGVCNACTPGKYQPTQGNPCTIAACAAGTGGTTYGATTFAEVCKTCPVGKKGGGNINGAAGVVSTCVLCDSSHYQDERKQSTCKNCPDGGVVVTVNGDAATGNSQNIGCCPYRCSGTQGSTEPGADWSVCTGGYTWSCNPEGNPISHCAKGCGCTGADILTVPLGKAQPPSCDVGDRCDYISKYVEVGKTYAMDHYVNNCYATTQGIAGVNCVACTARTGSKFMCYKDSNGARHCSTESNYKAFTPEPADPNLPCGYAPKSCDADNQCCKGLICITPEREFYGHCGALE
jgi:hypothetical protein